MGAKGLGAKGLGAKGLGAKGLGALALLSASALATAVAAQAPAPYPDSLDRAEVSRWLAAETDIPPEALVGVSQGRAFAAAVGGGGAPGVTAAAIVEQALTPAAAASMGGRSLRTDAEVRCAERRVRLGVTTVFPGVRADGPGREVRGSSGWQPAPAGSMIGQVAAQVCAAAASPDTLAGASAELGSGHSALQSATEPAPAAAEAPSPAPALKPRAGAGGMLAQIGAFPSSAAAQAAWREAGQASSTAGLRLRTELVKSGGRTLYRALVEGFPSAAEAHAFCAALKAAERACLVRR